MDYKILQGLFVPSSSFGFCFTDLLLVFAFVIFLCLLLSILLVFAEDGSILMLLIIYVNYLKGSFLVQGLGTSTAQEGREYFKAITDHKKDFVWEDDQDGNHIELAFSKKGTADRKQWLTNFQVSSCIFPQFGMVSLCWINTKSAN